MAPLRRWQAEALQVLDATGGRHRLVVAPPGSGKSRLALEHHARRRDCGSCDFLVVLVPTACLRAQWIDAARLAGVDLDARTASGTSYRGVHGICMTYAALAADPQGHRETLKGLRALIVADEVHRLGDRKTWADAVRTVLAGHDVLALTATPFRGDADAIPYVRYDQAGRAVPTYRHHKDAAVAAGDTVPIDQIHVDARVTWQVDDVQTSMLLSQADGDALSPALATALRPGSPWCVAAADDAVADLARRRRTRPGAAGLVIAATREHARAWKNLLSRKGQSAVVALGDDPHAADVIGAYCAGAGDWLVTVHMAVEGVDAPRAEILVYASPVRSPRYVDQAVGRLSRRGDADEPARVYLPAVDAVVDAVDADVVLAASALADRQTERGRQDHHVKNVNPLECTGVVLRIVRAAASLPEPAHADGTVADPFTGAGDRTAPAAPIDPASTVAGRRKSMQNRINLLAEQIVRWEQGSGVKRSTVASVKSRANRAAGDHQTAASTDLEGLDERIRHLERRLQEAKARAAAPIV